MAAHLCLCLCTLRCLLCIWSMELSASPMDYLGDAGMPLTSMRARQPHPAALLSSMRLLKRKASATSREL